MSREFKVELNFGYGWDNITSLTRVKEFYRERYLYNNIQPTTDSCKFKMKYSQNILSKLLLTDDDIKARIQVKVDGVFEDYFYGFVQHDYKTKSTARVEWVELSLVDNSYILEKSLEKDIALNDLHLFDYTNKSSSLVHQICYKAGMTDDEISDTIAYESDGTTKVGVPFFKHLKSKPENDNTALSEIPYGGSYKDIMKNVLFQFGFTYYFNTSGELCIFSFRDTNIETTKTFDNTNIIGTLEFNKKSPAYKSSAITYSNREVVEDQVVWADTTGGNSINSCNIELAAGEYYPATASASFTPTTYFNFKLPDGRGSEDIIAVTNLTRNFQFDGYTHSWTTTETITPTSEGEVDINGYYTRVYDDYDCMDAAQMLLVYDKKIRDSDEWEWWTKSDYGACRCKPFNIKGWKVTRYVKKWGVIGSQTVTTYGTPYDLTTTHYGSAASAVTSDDITFTPYPLSFEYKIYNPGGRVKKDDGTYYDSNLYPVNITKLEVRGDCILKGIDTIFIDDRYGSTLKTFEYSADYIYTEEEAQALAESITDYFINSTYKFKLVSNTLYEVGDWVYLTDTNFENVDNFPVENKRCLVVSRKDEEFLGKYTYTLEEYADYV